MVIWFNYMMVRNDLGMVWDWKK